MTEQELVKANEIKEEIKRLKDFLFYAERVWTGRIIKQTSKFIFKSDAYGVMNSAEYFMDTEMKNRVLDVLRERLSELKTQLESI